MQHYWDLWALDPSATKGMSELKITDEFEGDNVVINEDDIESFCRVVGNEGEAYKKGHKGGMQVPLDFAIKLGWKVRSLWDRWERRLELELTPHSRSPS